MARFHAQVAKGSAVKESAVKNAFWPQAAAALR
jgi:hypothetical protein